MTKNLNVAKFRNGDLIQEAKTGEEWIKAAENKQPAWCYYNNNSDNGDRYGKLYNFYAVNDPRGLAPKGWKIPSDYDWNRLIDFLGGENLAEKKMKSSDLWAEYEGKSCNGTNESGFSGLPGGERSVYDENDINENIYNNGKFSYLGMGGCWWSSSKYNTHRAWCRGLSRARDAIFRDNSPKGAGHYVRCLRD